MLQIRRLIFNGLHSRNALDSGALALLIVSLPLGVLWMPLLINSPEFAQNPIGMFAALGMVMIFAYTAAVGFALRRVDAINILLGILLNIASAALHYAYDGRMVATSAIVGLLGAFLIMRSMPRAVARNNVLDTLSRVRRRSWGLTNI